MTKTTPPATAGASVGAGSIASEASNSSYRCLIVKRCREIMNSMETLAQDVWGHAAARAANWCRRTKNWTMFCWRSRRRDRHIEPNPEWLLNQSSNSIWVTNEVGKWCIWGARGAFRGNFWYKNRSSSFCWKWIFSASSKVIVLMLGEVWRLFIPFFSRLNRESSTLLLSMAPYTSQSLS